VSIGETLAEARSQAGLTIADVSEQTRIRPVLIRAIEQDDFQACGADFYARGHIRAIAAAVGADGPALIREYDEAHPSAQPMTLEDLLERRPPARQRQHRQRARGRAAWLAVAAVLVLAVIGFAADKVVSASTGPQRLASSSSTTARTRAPASSAAPSVTSVATTPGGPASPTAAPASTVTPASVTPVGPGGPSDGDNPQQAPLALSGDPATPWQTDWYTTASFGSLESGTGLLLDLGHPVTITGAAIQLGSTPGADFQLRAGTTQADLATVAAESGAGGLVRLRLSVPVRARYLLIWFTLLPPDGQGTYQADVSAVTVAVT
jgi:cytoskeletal protein RodZ